MRPGFFFRFVFGFDFAFDEVEDLWLSSEEVGMAEYVFAGVFAALVKTVHIELAYEGVNVSVAEVLGEDMILEVIDLFDGELTPVGHPVDDGLVLLVF